MIMYLTYFLEVRTLLIINKGFEPIIKKVCFKITLFNFEKTHRKFNKKICHVFLLFSP